MRARTILNGTVCNEMIDKNYTFNQILKQAKAEAKYYANEINSKGAFLIEIMYEKAVNQLYDFSSDYQPKNIFYIYLDGKGHII